MGDLSIKIKIVDREYPIKVSASQEEKLRKAGKEINERVKTYRTQFGIDDKQDLLAMVAINCMVEKIRSEENQSQVQAVSAKIDRLDELINSVL
jgi:cell division protein ZapA